MAQTEHTDTDVRSPAGLIPATTRHRRRGWALLPASIAALVLGATGIGFGLVAYGAQQRPENPDAGRRSLLPASAAREQTPESTEAPQSKHEATSSDTTSIDQDWLTHVADTADIPERALSAYVNAALRIGQEQPECGLGWNTLAAIGYVESAHGTVADSHIDENGNATPPIIGTALDGQTTDTIPDTDSGTLDGDNIWDRAVGPMQFIPSTWAKWGSDGNGDGKIDPQNIDDAAYSAARYLCASGDDLRVAENWIDSIATYNNAVDYNNKVAEAATRFAEASAAQ